MYVPNDRFYQSPSSTRTVPRISSTTVLAFMETTLAFVEATNQSVEVKEEERGIEVASVCGTLVRASGRICRFGTALEFHTSSFRACARSE